TPCASLGFVIARSDSDEAIQTLAQAALDCFACARNDEQATSFSRSLRARALPTTTHKKIRFLQQKGGEAPKGACANHVPAAPTDVAICQALSAAARLYRRRPRLPALPLRRSPPATTPMAQPPKRGFLKTRRTKCFARSPHNALS